MSILIKDLNDSKELDRTAMADVRGGLDIGSINMVAEQSQNIISGANSGNITALNMPVFAPLTVITEVSPTTTINFDMANLGNVINSQVIL